MGLLNRNAPHTHVDRFFVADGAGPEVPFLASAASVADEIAAYVRQRLESGAAFIVVRRDIDTAVEEELAEERQLVEELSSRALLASREADELRVALIAANAERERLHAKLNSARQALASEDLPEHAAADVE